MAVIRVHKTENYTVMSNVHLRDKSITLKARGLLSTILSLPDDWKYSMSGLTSICKEGASAVKSALQELSEAGYVTVTKLYPNQTETGRIEYVYDIHESPQESEKQGIENLHLECLGVENRTLLSTKEVSTEEVNTKEQKERKKPAETFDSIIDGFTQDPDLREALMGFLQYRVASCKKGKNAFTNHALKLNLSKLSKLSCDPAEMVEIVNQTVERGWSGFYELKKDDRRQLGTAKDGGARNAEYVSYAN